MKRKEDNPKRILLVLLLLVPAFGLLSQNINQKTITSRSKYVFIELNTIEYLRIVNSESNEITITSENDFGGSASFEVIEEKNDLLIRQKQQQKYADESIDKNCVEQPVYPSFVIRIPKDKKVHILFDEGNFFAGNFSGDISLKIEKGVAEIDNFNGEFRLDINVGKVVCKVADTRMNARTNLGKIYLEGNPYGNTFNEVIGKPVNNIRINALKASIYIEKP